MDDLADDKSMGGYGHEQERERLRLQEKIAAGEDMDGEEGDRKEIFTPVIMSLVSALGGWEDVLGEDGQLTRFYRPGDSIIGCLRDLKKLWRKDDTDDERTVARIFIRSNLVKELVAIIEEVSDRGPWGMKVGLLAADLLTAMTWPIDVAAELKEMEDEPPAVSDYGSLLAAQLDYKAAVLGSGMFLQRMMALVLPSLAKASRERQEKDERIISLVLHLIRNLLQVKDTDASVFDSNDNHEKSALQSRLITQLESSSFLPLLLTLASSALTKDFNPFNILVLDILHLLFQSVSASELAKDQISVHRDGLASLLAQEARVEQQAARSASSRHSRFGATISIRQGSSSGKNVVLNRSAAIQGDAGDLLDQRKKKGRAAKGVRKVDELARRADLSSDALKILKRFSTEFLESCFNNFFSSVLKDIRMERQKVREADNVRALFLSTFFIEFFLSSRALALAREDDASKKGKAPMQRGSKTASEWDFGYVAEFSEIEAVKWVVARMRLTMDDKPIGWTELQAGISCFTQILLLVDAMALSADEEAVEAAEIMQNQIYYNGDILDMAHLVVLKFKDQSLAYLDAVIHLNYVLLRMLEKYSKANSYMYVRKRKAKRAKRKRIKNGEPVVNENENEDEEEEADRGAAQYAEHAFTFEKFALRFAQEDILRTYLTYLERFAEFNSPDRMKRIVKLLYRLAVTIKAEGLFFKVSVLDLFQTILTNRLTLPQDSSSTDLLSLIDFILRKFFKRAQEEPFLLVEAFFPKNRDHWKKFSSWAPEDGEPDGGDEGTSRAEKKVKKVKIPAEVQIKDNSLSPSQQIGVAVAILLESGKMSWVTSTIELLKDVAAARQEIVLSTDGIPDEDDDEARGPSNDALQKITAHIVITDDEERRLAMSMNPHLKLLLRLVDCELTSDENALPYEWTIPADILPSELEANALAIEQYIREPVELNGEKATDKLKRKIRTRQKRKRSPAPEDEEEEEGEERAKRPRQQKRKAEVQTQYKSAQFIYDSDDDTNDVAFFAAEKERIERRARENELGITSAPPVRRKAPAKKAAGAKAPRAKPKPKAKPKKGKGRQRDSASGPDNDSDEEEAQASDGEGSAEEEEARPKPRAKPKARTRKTQAPAETFGDDSDVDQAGSGGGGMDVDRPTAAGDRSESEEEAVSQAPRAKKRVVMESDESE